MVIAVVAAVTVAAVAPEIAAAQAAVAPEVVAEVAAAQATPLVLLVKVAIKM